MKSTADVVIIGAGVIGCSTAYHLAARGIADVAVVEMGQVGSGSTSKSAAMLSLQFCHDELSAAHGAAFLCSLHAVRGGDRCSDRLQTHWLAVCGDGGAMRQSC